jgi:uncharacterized protein
VTRRLRLTWPDERPFRSRAGRPIRLLAASDEPDPALEFASNRDALGPIDAIVGSGDLEPYWLEFLADAFSAPLSFVRGNHDKGLGWEAKRARLPEPLKGGSLTTVAGIQVAALPWSGHDGASNVRDDRGAWGQVVPIAARLAAGTLRGRRDPIIVLSHAPPTGAGEGPDTYHLGFGAYRWLLDWFRPPLWLHGHVTTATVPALRVSIARTTLVNVTGSVLVELVPPE